MGKALSAFPRPSYVLSTKVYWAMRDDPNGKGLSRKHIIEECDASLRRLGVDYIDIYYCHRFDDETPLEETLRTMDDLVRRGKVLYIGVSTWTANQIQEAVRIADKYLLDRIIVNQPKYNILNRQIEQEIIPICKELGIGQIVYSPLAQGFLTGKYQDDEIPPPKRTSLPNLITGKNKEIVSELQILAWEENLSLIQLVLAWALRNKNIASTIVGASNPIQIEQCITASGIIISPKIIDKIDNLLLK